MKTSLYFLVIVLSLSVFVSCGGDASKKTPEIKKEVKSASKTKVSSSKGSLTATVPIKNDNDQEIDGATPKQLKKAKEIIKSVSEDAIAAVDAKKKFKMLCASCHGFKGNLNINGAKDLTISKVDLNERVAQVYFGKGLMTPFKGVMSDAEIVAVSKYLETLRD